MHAVPRPEFRLRLDVAATSPPKRRPNLHP